MYNCWNCYLCKIALKKCIMLKKSSIKYLQAWWVLHQLPKFILSHQNWWIVPATESKWDLQIPMYISFFFCKKIEKYYFQNFSHTVNCFMDEFSLNFVLEVLIFIIEEKPSKCFVLLIVLSHSDEVITATSPCKFLKSQGPSVDKHPSMKPAISRQQGLQLLFLFLAINFFSEDRNEVHSTLLREGRRSFSKFSG